MVVDIVGDGGLGGNGYYKVMDMLPLRTKVLWLDTLAVKTEMFD
jgi:hypothetical protein